MTDHWKSVLTTGLEFVFLACIFLTVPYVVSLDALVFKNDVEEYSLTEILQSLLVLATALLFVFSAVRCPQTRGFSVLLAGFFACIFIREGDLYLDFIQHGFWKYPVIVTAITASAYALRHRQSFWTTYENFLNTKAHHYLLIGILVVIVFSRSFGSGGLLWKDIMEENYRDVLRNAIQEGLELFGYTLLFYGAVSFFKNIRAHNQSNESKLDMSNSIQN